MVELTLNRLKTCPCCSGQTAAIQSAFISPWLRQLGSIPVRRSTYRVCDSCKSGFFDYRYTSQEMAGIYSGYRGTRYFSLRNEWEPSYTAELNNALGHDSNVLAMRHEFVRSALANGIQDSSIQISTVIDVGGDKGQFIPPEFTNKFVLDVSEKDPIPEVGRVAAIEDASRLQPDLVMACGIFEHVSDPFRFLQELLSIDSNERDLLVYIEVPSGVPQRRAIQQRVWGRLLGPVASRSLRMWSRLDDRSASLARRGRGTSRLMPMRQSEHINFFSMQGLQELATRAGGHVLLLDEVSVPSALLANGRIQFSGSLRMLLRAGNP